MRRFVWIDLESTCTSTSWLVEIVFPGWMFFLVQLISDTWIEALDAGLRLDEGAIVRVECASGSP